MIESEKYQAAWANPRYRAFSPGEYAVTEFLAVTDAKPGDTVRDLGCGSGRAGTQLARRGLKVTQYDFAENCRDAEIDLPFALHDLTQLIPGLPADWVFCCDVMEHIPPEDVRKVLLNVVRAGWRVFLGICTDKDDYGPQLLGHPLHLTVQPAEWWREQLEALDCKILWSRTADQWAYFLVSAYADAVDFGPKTVLNVSHEALYANVKANLAAGYEEIQPHARQDVPLLIMAGGPSLLEHRDEIIERRKAGEFLVTVNAAHGLCREWGIEPSLQVMCDARPFNRRFVENPFPKTKYLIASQCDPAVAASLPRDQVLMWHSGDFLQETIKSFDIERGAGREWYPVYGGGTVMLRALPLLMMLGFYKFEIFGWDGCLLEHEGKLAHHAYAQPENDRTDVITLRVGRRLFQCHPWMVAQAGDFIKVIRVIGPHVSLIVHGDGLIAHIIKTAAEEN